MSAEVLIGLIVIFVVFAGGALIWECFFWRTNVKEALDFNHFAKIADKLMSAFDTRDISAYRRTSREMRILDYKRTFSTPHGRRVLADILDNAGLLRPNHGFRENSEVAGVVEGRRQIGLDIIHVMGTIPEEEIEDGDGNER